MASNTVQSSMLDMTIFNIEEESQCCDGFQTCGSIKRLLSSLKYYTLLQPHHHKENQDIFTKFMNDIYKERVLDDFYHLTKSHEGEIQQIMDSAINVAKFKKCSINKCEFANRHYRVNITQESDNVNAFDSHWTLHSEIMDSLHHYIFHLFETGYRFNEKDIDSKSDADDIIDDDEFYDKSFSKMVDIISSTRSTTAKFDRIRGGLKYDIVHQNQYNYNPEMDPEMKQMNSNTTYLDTLFDHLTASKIDEKIIKKLAKYLKDEAYDTESMDADLKIQKEKGNGNISHYMKDYKLGLYGFCCIFLQSIQPYVISIYVHVACVIQIRFVNTIIYIQYPREHSMLVSISIIGIKSLNMSANKR